MKEPISQADDKPTKWLITGGCGFIGTSLIKNLISEGNHYIRVLDNLSVGTRDDLARVSAFSEKQKVKSKENVKPSSLKDNPSPPEDPSLLTSNSSLKNNSSRAQLIVGDITDYEICLSSAKNIDVIVHLAANTGVGPSVEDPRKDMESNVIGTFNMLESARHNGVKRFVFASSGAPVGECEPPIHEELAPHPVSPYGASKLAGEGYCSSYFRTYGIKTIALRFGNVYGPGSGHKNSVIAKFIKQAMNGEILEIYGDGNQTRDFIYIDDLIDAIRKASDFSLLTPNSSQIFGEVFQIATNKETTVGEMVDILIPILKKTGINDIKTAHGEKRLGDVMRNYSDTSKSLNTLVWKCTHDLYSGIEKTVDWFVSSR